MAPSNLALRSRSHLLAKSILEPRAANLSSGAKAGIVIGCVFGVAILLCISWPFIARLRRKRRGKAEEAYHPSQDDPTLNLDVPHHTDTDRRLSAPGAEDKPGISSDAVYDPQRSGSGVPTSPFDPNYPVPPHYRDHPDYLAYQAAQAAAAVSLPSVSAIVIPPQPTYQGPGVPSGHVSIQPPSSRFEQLKDNAKNKLAWSADKAQFIKKAFHDKKKADEVPSIGQTRSFYGDDSSSPVVNKPSYWISSFHSQEVGPSARHLGSQANSAQYPSHLISPVSSGLSPPISPQSRVLETFDDPEHQDSTLLSGGKSGLPSPPLTDQQGFNPTHLWRPTNLSERQHRVNQELDTFRATPVAFQDVDAPTSPSPKPVTVSLPPDLDHSQPSPDPSIHIEPATPGPQPASHPTPEPDIKLVPQSTPSMAVTSRENDIEMADAFSNVSTPTGRVFSAMSNQNTPESRFTSSDAVASPRSTHNSELGFTSPAPFPSDQLKAESSDTGSPPESQSVVSPGDTASITSPRSYTCDECGKTFEQIHRLNHHRRYHDRKHECTVEGCNKKFGTKTHLDRHINDKHKKTRKFYCTEPSCQYSIQGGKSFPRKDNWVRHIRKKHRNLSVNQLEAQGFLIDEETGVAQSVAAPPGQNTQSTHNKTAHQQNVEMGYGVTLGVPTTAGSAPAGYPLPGTTGYPLNSNMMEALNIIPQHSGMHHNTVLNMGGDSGIPIHMNIQQPPMPPGTGFNSHWNMGPMQNSY